MSLFQADPYFRSKFTVKSASKRPSKSTLRPRNFDLNFLVLFEVEIRVSSSNKLKLLTPPHISTVSSWVGPARASPASKELRIFILQRQKTERSFRGIKSRTFLLWLLEHQNWPFSKSSENVSLVRVVLSPFCNFLKSLIISSSTFFVLVVGCWRPPCVPSKVSLHLVLTCAQSVRLIPIFRKKSLFKGKKSTTWVKAKNY